MQPIEVAGVALTGVGLVLTAAGLLLGMIPLSPVTAYASGTSPGASAAHARRSPRRVLWTRVLVLGAGLAIVGMTLINFASP